jgi:hypothetical protein
MAQYRAEYMVDGTYWLPSKNDFVQRASFGRLCGKAGFSKYGTNLRKNLRFVPCSMVGLERTLPRALFTAEGGEKVP